MTRKENGTNGDKNVLNVGTDKKQNGGSTSTRTAHDAQTDMTHRPWHEAKKFLVLCKVFDKICTY